MASIFLKGFVLLSIQTKGKEIKFYRTKLLLKPFFKDSIFLALSVHSVELNQIYKFYQHVN